MRDRRTLIRQMSVILASAVLMLALILVAAVCGGMATPDEPTESDYHFVPGIPPEGFDPSEWMSGRTMPDSERGTWEPGTGEPITREPGTETGEPLTGFGTAPGWATLPPEPGTAPEPEWPTLPSGWDTLPPGWDTLPPDWGDMTMPGVDDIGDILAGMNGSLQNPVGALGAGVAAQLTMFRVTAEIDDEVYFKMQSFGAYNGTGWEPAKASPVRINGLYSADYLMGLTMERADPMLPAYVLSVTKVMDIKVLPYYVVGIDRGTVTSDVLPAEGLDNADRWCYIYRHYEDLRDPTRIPDSLMMNSSMEYLAYAQDTYLDMGTGFCGRETENYIDRIIAREGFDASDPNIVERVADYVKQAAKYDLNYDKRLDSESNIALAFLGGYRAGVCRHFATAATLIYRRLGIPARYTVGFRADVRGGAQVYKGGPSINGGPATEVKGKDAHAWVEIYREGEGWIYVEVTPPPAADERIALTLSPANVNRVYIPGERLEPTGELKGFESFSALGYSYDALVYGEQTEPGVSESIIQYIRIFDPDGRDVTDYFNIRLEPGRVQVYRAELAFTSLSAQQVYNGQELVLPEDGYRMTAGALPEDGNRYQVEIIPTGSQRDAGTSLATYRVVIRQAPKEGDPEGEWPDVTGDFRIRRAYGTLTVTPAPITVQLADQQKIYDGKPLVANNATLAEDPALVPGDFISRIEVEGTQTVVGRSESNITSLLICNEQGENVTRNYRITYLPGTLQVLAE